jgi:hypothetical protein
MKIRTIRLHLFRKTPGKKEVTLSINLADKQHAAKRERNSSHPRHSDPHTYQSRDHLPRLLREGTPEQHRRMLEAGGLYNQDTSLTPGQRRQSSLGVIERPLGDPYPSIPLCILSWRKSPFPLGIEI